MFSLDQVLALMRERVHHPAAMRELLQVLKVPRDERTSFKRHIKSLVASGDLIQIRGHRFGLPEKMDLYVGRLQTHPAGYGFVVPERPLESGGGDIYISGPHLNEAMHGDRVVARIERDQGRRARRGPRSSASSSAATNRSSAATTATTTAWVTSCRSIAACSWTSSCRRARRAAPRRARWWPPKSRGGRRRRAARSAASPTCSATSTRPASTPRSSSASTASRTRTAPDAVAEAVRLGSGGLAEGHQRPHRLPQRPDGHHRRRARARFRRRDHDRAAAERPLLARRAHRRRLALRAGGQRARSRSVRARDVGVFPRARRAHVSVGAGHRAVQPQSRTSIGSCSRA